MPRSSAAPLLASAIVAILASAPSAGACSAATESSAARRYDNTVMLPDGKLMVWEVREAGPDGAFGPSRITLGDPRKPMFLGQLTGRVLNRQMRPSLRPITRADEDATAPAFAKDGKSVLFLSARGGETHPQVWEILLEGGEGNPVTDEPLGVREFVPMPDGSIVLLAGGQILRKVPGVVPSQILFEVPESAGELALSWDGAQAVYRGEHDDLWLLDIATRSVHRLTDRPGPETFPCWSYEDDAIYFLGRVDPSREDSVHGPFRVPAEGWSEPERVAPKLAADALELVSCGDTDRIFVIAAGTGGHSLVRIRPAEKKSQILFTTPDRLHGLAAREDGEKMTFVVEAEGMPPEIGSWDFPDDAMTVLTAPPPADEAASASESKGSTP